MLEKLFFAQYLSRSSLESCSNAPIFRASFPRRVGGGTNWRKVFKRSETDSKLRIWLTYFGPNRSKIWESFFGRKLIESEILFDIITLHYYERERYTQIRSEVENYCYWRTQLEEPIWQPTPLLLNSP